MRIRQRLDGIDHLNIKADNINIRSVSNQRLLGLNINENLNWKTHIEIFVRLSPSKYLCCDGWLSMFPCKFKNILSIIHPSVT